jgi:hypothetical protein
MVGFIDSYGEDSESDCRLSLTRDFRNNGGAAVVSKVRL